MNKSIKKIKKFESELSSIQNKVNQKIYSIGGERVEYSGNKIYSIGGKRVQY